MTASTPPSEHNKELPKPPGDGGTSEPRPQEDESDRTQPVIQLVVNQIFLSGIAQEIQNGLAGRARIVQVRANDLERQPIVLLAINASPRQNHALQVAENDLRAIRDAGAQAIVLAIRIGHSANLYVQQEGDPAIVNLRTQFHLPSRADMLDGVFADYNRPGFAALSDLIEAAVQRHPNEFHYAE